MADSSSRWILGLGGCVAVAILVAQTHPLPPHLGIILAIAAFLSGALLGARGFVPVYVAIAAYGVARFIGETVTPSGGEDQRALVVLYFTIIPALFAMPTAVGALLRRTVLVARQK